METVADAPKDKVEKIEHVVLIEVLDVHGRMQERRRLAAPGTNCKIGRSLACDLVVDDPYAAAEHAVLSLLEDGSVQVTDLGTLNGTRINDARESRKVSNTSVAVQDSELIVGRTRVRIRTAHRELPPERLFRRDPLQRHRTTLACLGLAAVFVLAATNDWLDGPERLAPKILSSLLALAVVIAAWVGMWALITRIGHGALNLRIHVAIACIALAAEVVASGTLGVAAFSTQWSWFDGLKSLAIVGIVLCALFLHLRTATHLSRRVTIILAVIIPLTLGGAFIWIQQQTELRDVNRTATGAAIYPPALRLARGADPHEYFSGMDTLKRNADRLQVESLTENPLAPISK